MAQAVRYICNHCSKSIVAWDDGNPYYFDEAGEKRYAHHPHPDREKCVGNDGDFLCLHCSAEFRADAALGNPPCPQCGSPETADTWRLSGKACPECTSGTFERDEEYFAIS